MQSPIVELELWSLPGSSDAPFDGKAVAASCRDATGLDAAVVLGLNFVPGPNDVQDLQAAFACGALRSEDFLSFCSERGLEASAGNVISAAEFLAFAKGQPLAWLHFPAEPAGFNMACSLIEWASHNGMQLHDGASTYEPLTEAQIHGLWHQ